MHANDTAPPKDSATSTASRSPQSQCPLCGSTSVSVRFRLRDYEINHCNGCQLDYNATFSGGGGEDGLFNEHYFLEHHEAAFASHAEDYRKDPSFEIFEKHLIDIEEKSGTGRLLDVGPGLGTFLRIARERGWDAEGLDISEFGAEHIRRVHDIRMTVGHLHEADLPESSFDLITFWDSIEHVAHPLRDLARAFELLKPGGHVLLTTDNFDCLVAGLANAIYRSTFGKVEYPVRRVFIDKNFAYFTDKTLAQSMRDIGFVDIALSKMEYPIEKINLNWLERLSLSSIYWMASVTGREAQITALARKP
ncbi:Ubiquinone biosynthesis O-methyltransferase [Maioricimonas rarisocia]|uniref:Ubiquinone biosynthesis O-methyltransferase n=1 Tax=Maioricimonas rarisocia TaxID=2528026 RepID=A0A517Z0S2_9PLAN|nr:class I SAM-dependent methyltransferase [Maioricimonas rarisocia]QDU36077.1 Ubiquinone biosynthesis O-methyltransferase [Maioricimonas rarisocia]